MKVLVLTHFSRGDVQPFAALAKELQLSGHEVTVGATATFEYLLKPYSVRVISFPDRTKTIVSDPAIRRLSAKGVPLQLLPKAVRERARMLDDFARTADSAPDIVVHSAALPGHQVAELLGVPAVPVCPHPAFVPTDSFSNPFFPFRVPPAFNRASYLWTGLFMRTLFPSMGRWRRKTLGLSRRRGHRDVLMRPDGAPATVLQPFSRHVLPQPLHYPNSVHTTGYWLLPAAQDWQPPPELTAFLHAGDPPVYLGFGSMALTDPARLGRLVARAVRLAGVRAVVVGGWGAIDPTALRKNTLYLPEAPFDWLFPRTAAVVHHGGNGTIGYALAAGRPQVVCPFSGTDQTFYARRLQACGVAPAPQPHRHFTAEGLAEAIVQAVTDSRMAERANEVAHRVRAEHGTQAAVKILEALA